MFLRIKFSADAEGNQTFEYGSFCSQEDLEEIYDDSFMAADWSCKYDSFHEVGRPYQHWFLALVEEDVPLCVQDDRGRFFDANGALLKTRCYLADIITY